MSKSATPVKRKLNLKRDTSKTVQIINHEDNNNKRSKLSEQQPAKSFALWYKRMIDHERLNIGLYISDDAVFEWFGRTIRTRKKIVGFLKYDMQCSRHDFTTIESKENITSRTQTSSTSNNEEHKFASPLPLSGSPTMLSDPSRKRPGLRSNSQSPKWDTNSKQSDEDHDSEVSARKKIKICKDDTEEGEKQASDDSINCKYNIEQKSEVNNKGDGVTGKMKRKYVPVTPPNVELGQGDCHPSTSDSMSDVSHSHLNAQLPRKVVECNGYIEFIRMRNSRNTDSMKWERKCKVQISYSEDPLNIGEYIIWAIHYSDESKCRRNLLAAFEEVSEQ